MPLQFAKRLLAAQAETVYGTAETLTNADAAFKVSNLQMAMRASTIPRNGQGVLGSTDGVAGPVSYELSFQTMFHGSGSTNTAAWATAFLASCGMIASGGTFTATGANTSWKSITAGAYIDGRMHTGIGGMGSFTLTCPAGEPAIFDWRYQLGYSAAPTNSALLTGITYESVVPPTLGGATNLVTLGGTAYKASRVVIDIGNEVAMREDVNGVKGYCGGWIGNRNGTVRIDPEADAAAAWFTTFLNGGTAALSLTIGNVATNRATVTASLQLAEAPAEEDRGGKLVDSLFFNIIDDSLVIAFG
jgi:hypothetical protein